MYDRYRSVTDDPLDIEINALVLELGYPSLLYPCRIARRGRGVAVRVASPMVSEGRTPLCLGVFSPELLRIELAHWSRRSRAPVVVAVLFDKVCARTPLSDGSHHAHIPVVSELGFVGRNPLENKPSGEPWLTVFGSDITMTTFPWTSGMRQVRLAFVAQGQCPSGTFGTVEADVDGEGIITRFDAAGPVPLLPCA